MTTDTMKQPALTFDRTTLPAWIHPWCLAWILAMLQLAHADTTINSGETFTIDKTNTAVETGTWADTGKLTMFNGATLQTWLPCAVNNDAIVLAGTSGTIALRFNGNDMNFMFNGAISSTATAAQTLAFFTGYNGNGDRASVTVASGIPNCGDGSALSLNVTFNTQGSPNWVNLPAVNTFTGPITLARSSAGPASGALTIGGTWTRGIGGIFAAAVIKSGSGSLNSGNYPGAIALGDGTILNFASSATQTLAGPISGLGSMLVSGTGAVTLSGSNTYSGNTTVNSGGTLVLGNGGGLKFVVADATSNKVTGGGTATLNGSFTIDTSAVAVTSGSWPLVDATNKSFGGSFGLVGFTGPVSNVFTKVVGAQNWTFTTTTGVLNLRSKAIITAFGIAGNAGVINQTSKAIAMTVPYGTSLATLAPTFTSTSGTCNQTSGSPPSPTFAASNPAHYIVTDGNTSADYTVTISTTPASTNKDILAFNLGGAAGTISGTNITLTVPAGPGVTNLAPTYTVSTFASGTPPSGTNRDFTTPQTYTITAQDGSTKKYLVTVLTYQAWSKSASFHILTDAAGADLPAAASETDFPLLIRLNTSNFTFSQAASDGRDIRFSTAGGVSLSYQIEQWDSVNSTAAVWVKIPTITGNTRQAIKMYWGNADATSESDGAAVFNAANGYASVLHMDETVSDAVGTLTPTDTGTTPATGTIGKGRNFVAGKGVKCGTNITTFASGSGPHTSEAWVRPTTTGTLLAWGGQTGQGKVVMQLLSPPHLNVDTWGSGATVTGASSFPLSQWTHVAHTYQNGEARLYVNGVQDAIATGGTAMKIPNPVHMYLGGWHDNYTFAGDMDEVRISKVTRSANWIKLEYQNQNPLQTLVGSLVQNGSAFSVAAPTVTMNEGTIATLSGQAQGAQKVSWVRVRNGQETVLAVDRFSLDFAAGRVTGNQSFVLRFKAIYPTETKIADVAVKIVETIPEPVCTLTAPATWDGRQTINITPNISNLAALQAAGVASFNYTWSAAGVALAKQITPGRLTLTRAQGSGPLSVTLTMDNGGSPVTVTQTIAVQEPASDAWVQRTPGATEKAVNGQFFARDPNTGKGAIYYNGTQSDSPAAVFLKVYTTDTGADVPYSTLRQALVAGAYAFTAPVDAGKVTYKVVYGTTNGGVDTNVATVTDLVCGDAYIIEGQSNALALDNSAPNNFTTNKWIRTYGSSGGGWGYAVSKGSEMYLGLWGYDLARTLVATHNMPVCFINGAVGGTLIHQHQPNPADHGAPGTSYSIYASLYKRVIGARLTHGIRGVFWHQGESDSATGDPTGDWNYKSYQQYFVDMSAAWKQDFPNIQRYIIYQVQPKPCSMGPKGDQLRDMQRTLPLLFSNMSILSTIGMAGYEGCHYSAEGYKAMADLTAPLVGRDFYGEKPAASVTAPILRRAYYTSGDKNAITLEFDQDISWNPLSTVNFYLDRVAGKVTGGSAKGKVVTLTLSASSTSQTIDYLEDNYWSGSAGNLLTGTNAIPVLTFSGVVIGAPAPPRAAAR